MSRNPFDEPSMEELQEQARRLDIEDYYRAQEFQGFEGFEGFDDDAKEEEIKVEPKKEKTTTEKGEKRESVLQIPFTVIRNPNITDVDFAIFALLKYFHYLRQQHSEYRLTTRHISEKLGIKDNRTIKKSLSRLYEQGFLDQPTESIPRSGKIEADITNQEGQYGQIPTSLLDHIVSGECIGTVGYRLMYYHISYKNHIWGISYMSQARIMREIGASHETIITYTKKLEDAKFIKVQRQFNMVWEGYDEDTGRGWGKSFVNKYTVLLSNIKKLQDNLKDGQKNARHYSK